MDTDVTLTLIALAVGAALVATSITLDKRRRRVFTTGFVPIMPILFLGAIIALLALIHLTTIWRDYR